MYNVLLYITNLFIIVYSSFVIMIKKYKYNDYLYLLLINFLKFILLAHFMHYFINANLITVQNHTVLCAI